MEKAKISSSSMMLWWKKMPTQKELVMQRGLGNWLVDLENLINLQFFQRVLMFHKPHMHQIKVEEGEELQLLQWVD